MLFPLLAPVLNPKSNHLSSHTNSNTGYCLAFHFHNTGYCLAFHFHNIVLLSLSQHCFTAFTFTTLFYCFHFHNIVLLLSLPQHCFTAFTFTTLFYCFHFHNIVLLLSLSQHCFTAFTSTTLFYCFHFHNTVLLLSLPQHCFTAFTFTTLFYCFHFHNTVLLISLLCGFCSVSPDQSETGWELGKSIKTDSKLQHFALLLLKSSNKRKQKVTVMTGVTNILNNCLEPILPKFLVSPSSLTEKESACMTLQWAYQPKEKVFLSPLAGSGVPCCGKGLQLTG